MYCIEHLEKKCFEQNKFPPYEVLEKSIAAAMAKEASVSQTKDCPTIAANITEGP
jgi:hypothetical protein